jgi:hypothetical protein
MNIIGGSKMFEYYAITDHVIKRYRQRIGECNKDIVRRIRQDIRKLNVKQIINDGNVRHIFTENSKEFIFTKNRNRWVLTTVIKRSRSTNNEAIDKRKRVATLA